MNFSCVKTKRILFDMVVCLCCWLCVCYRKVKPAAGDGKKEETTKDPTVKFLIAEDDDDDVNETNFLVSSPAPNSVNNKDNNLNRVWQLVYSLR